MNSRTVNDRGWLAERQAIPEAPSPRGIAVGKH